MFRPERRTPGAGPPVMVYRSLSLSSWPSAVRREGWIVERNNSLLHAARRMLRAATLGAIVALTLGAGSAADAGVAVAGIETRVVGLIAESGASGADSTS